MITARPFRLILNTMERMIQFRREKLVTLEAELNAELDIFFSQRSFLGQIPPLIQHLKIEIHQVKMEISELVTCYTLLDIRYKDLLKIGATNIGLLGESGNIGLATLEWVLGQISHTERIHICHLCWLYALLVSVSLE
jgi:hypothetical protein